MENYYVNTVMDLLKTEIEQIMIQDKEKYGKYTVIVANEKSVNLEKFYSRNCIYIVVRFMPAYIYYQQSVVPVTLKILSEANSIEVAQELMIEFAMTYNLRENDTKTLKQVYQTPSVTTNFNEVYDGYRTAFYMTGTFVISENSNPYEITIDPEDDIYDKDNLDNNIIGVIASGISAIIQTDSQPFYDTDGDVDTLGQFRAIGISFSTYMLDNAFCNKCIDVAFGLNNRTAKTKFKFRITFKNGRVVKKTYTLTSFDDSQNIGEFPALKLSFSV